MKKIFAKYLMVFLLGGLGGWIIPGFILPYFGIAPAAPVTITRREEIRIDDGVNTADITNRVKDSLVSVYVHEGQFGTAKFKLGGIVSGLVVAGDGLIVIPAEDARAGQRFTVILADGTTNEAQLAARDTYTGLAFLKIQKNNLPVINQVSAAHLTGGEKIVSVQKRGSESEVLVSPFTASKAGTASPSLFESNSFSVAPDILAMMPEVSSGQIGAVLLNREAALVGYVTSAGNAPKIIRTEDLTLLLRNYLDDGKIVWPRFGLSYLLLSPAQAKLADLPEKIGLLVKNDFAPFAAGDFVVGMDGRDLDFAENLQDVVLSKKPGEKIKLKVIRSEKEIELEATL